MKTNEVKNKMNEIDFIDSFKIKKFTRMRLESRYLKKHQ